MSSDGADYAEGMLHATVVCEKYQGREILDETLRPYKGLDHYVDVSEVSGLDG